MFKWFWTIFSLVAPDHKLEQQIDILLKVQVEFRHFWPAKASGRKGYINTKGWRLSTCTSSRSWIKGILARQMATTCPNVKWKDEFSVPSLNTSWMVFCLLLLSSGELSFKKQQNNTTRIRKSNLKLQRHFLLCHRKKTKRKKENGQFMKIKPGKMYIQFVYYTLKYRKIITSDHKKQTVENNRKTTYKCRAANSSWSSDIVWIKMAHVRRNLNLVENIWQWSVSLQILCLPCIIF